MSVLGEATEGFPLHLRCCCPWQTFKQLLVGFLVHDAFVARARKVARGDFPFWDVDGDNIGLQFRIFAMAKHLAVTFGAV